MWLHMLITQAMPKLCDYDHVTYTMWKKNSIKKWL